MHTSRLTKFKTLEIKTKGISWRYYDLGHGDKTIVILPNILVFPTPWFEYAKFLENKCRIVIPVYPHISNYEVMVEMLHTLLQALNIKKFILVGNSVGGVFAQVYQERYPQDVEGLILLATISPNKIFGILAGILYGLGKFTPSLLVKGFVYVGTYLSLTSDKVLNDLWHPVLKRHIFQRETKKSTLALGHCVISFCFDFKSKKISDIPVTIVNARRDIVFHPFFQDFSGAYPKAKIYEINDARHLLELSHKNIILQILQKYL